MLFAFIISICCLLYVIDSIDTEKKRIGAKPTLKNDLINCLKSYVSKKAIDSSLLERELNPI